MPNPKGINQYTGKGGAGKSKGKTGGVKPASSKKAIGPSNSEKIANAAKMFGTGSAQHKAAQKRFGGK